MTKRACAQCATPIEDSRPARTLFCTKKCGEKGRGRRWTAANPHRRVLISARSRALKKGIPFDLTLDDIVIPDVCPVLGVPLAPSGGVGTGAQLPTSPSIDRIDPARGYVRGNIRFISYRANTLKSNMTIPEVRALLAYMEAQ